MRLGLLFALTQSIALLVPYRSEAAKMEVKPLGQPCWAKNVLAGIVVTDRRDGRVYCGSGKALVRLDLQTRAAEQIAQAPADIYNVAIGPKGDLYISCGSRVYAVLPAGGGSR